MPIDKRILVACPIHQREWIIPYYLRDLYNLNYNKKLIDIYWIINNSTDNSLILLREFKQKYENEYNSITIEILNSTNKFKDDRKSALREQFTYSWLASLRNKLLKKCVQLDNDFLWSHDCDILFKPDTLNRLLSHNKNIVSCLLYNSYLFTPEEPWRHPNILKEIGFRQYQHIVNYRTKNPNKNSIGTLLPCEFTGASILISKDVCKVAKYDWHKLGEDEPFCYSARKAGFNLWCDISLYVQHVMGEQFLDQFKNFGIE